MKKNNFLKSIMSIYSEENDNEMNIYLDKNSGKLNYNELGTKTPREHAIDAIKARIELAMLRNEIHNEYEAYEMKVDKDIKEYRKWFEENEKEITENNDRFETGWNSKTGNFETSYELLLKDYHGEKELEIKEKLLNEMISDETQQKYHEAIDYDIHVLGGAEDIVREDTFDQQQNEKNHQYFDVMNKINYRGIAPIEEQFSGKIDNIIFYSDDLKNNCKIAVKTTEGKYGVISINDYESFEKPKQIELTSQKPEFLKSEVFKIHTNQKQGSKNKANKKDGLEI